MPGEKKKINFIKCPHTRRAKNCPDPKKKEGCRLIIVFYLLIQYTNNQKASCNFFFYEYGEGHRRRYMCDNAKKKSYLSLSCVTLLRKFEARLNL